MQQGIPFPRASFLGIPLELRLEIYRYLLLELIPIQLQFQEFGRPNWPHRLYGPKECTKIIPILQLCEQISEEALGVLYGENTFNVFLHGGRQNAFAHFAERNRQRIRYVEIVMRPMGVTYGEMLRLDEKSWRSVLAGLSRLCIVAQQPLEPRIFLDALSLEEDMVEWLRWSEPILRYINDRVSDTAVIEIDDDGREETSSLITNCLSGRKCRKVQTRAGDLFFKRGDFAWDSPCWNQNYISNHRDNWAPMALQIGDMSFLFQVMPYLRKRSKQQIFEI